MRTDIQAVKENHERSLKYQTATIYVDLSPYEYLFKGYMTGPVMQAYNPIEIPDILADRVPETPPVLTAKAYKGSAKTVHGFIDELVTMFNAERETSFLYLYICEWSPKSGVGIVRYGSLPHSQLLTHQEVMATDLSNQS